MKASTVTSHSHSHTKVDAKACHHKEKPAANFTIVIQKICAFAIGAFALYVNWKLFVPFFFVGVLIGIHAYNNNENFEHFHSLSACGHGAIEQWTGVKLPVFVTIIAIVAENICHIDHHARVFVPIVGVTIGAWAGKTASHYGDLIYKKLRVHFAQNSFNYNLGFSR